MTLRGLQLITTKPVIYVFNINEEDLANKEKQNELRALVSPAQSLFVNAQLEAELKDLHEDDAKELLESYGQDESGLNKVINAAYKTLGLQSYLTSGGTEVRAWTIKQGSTAPQAAGVIHTEFEKGLPLARRLRDINLPLLADVPEIEIEFIRSDEEPGGIGEIAVPVVAPAIANALFSASGVRLRELPLLSNGL